jgi:hypothetical protein
MADQWYLPAAQKLLKGDLDFDTVDLRAMLCMSNTTADTERNVSTLSGFTTLDKYDGSGYTDVDLAGVAIAIDVANSRVEIDYNDGSWGAAVGAGTRNWVGILFYVRVDGTTANDWPVAWKDLTPANGTGGPVNLIVNAEGALQATI